MVHILEFHDRLPELHLGKGRRVPRQDDTKERLRGPHSSTLILIDITVKTASRPQVYPHYLLGHKSAPIHLRLRSYLRQPQKHLPQLRIPRRAQPCHRIPALRALKPSLGVGYSLTTVRIIPTEDVVHSSRILIQHRTHEAQSTFASAETVFDDAIEQCCDDGRRSARSGDAVNGADSAVVCGGGDPFPDCGVVGVRQVLRSAQEGWDVNGLAYQLRYLGTPGRSGCKARDLSTCRP